MSLPTMIGVGRLIDDPELRFGPSGAPVCRLRIAFNSRKRQDDGSWVDDKSCFVDATVFGQAAEHVAENLTKATEVQVAGRLVTDQWEDRETGAKRSKNALLVDHIGPVVNNFQTAKVSKMDRQSQGNGRVQSGGSDGDPWATATPARSGGRSTDTDEPPF